MPDSKRCTRNNSIDISHNNCASQNEIKQLLDAFKSEIIQSFQSELKTVSEKLARLEEKTKSFEISLSQIQNKQHMYEKEIVNINSEISTMKCTMPDFISKELEERMKRSKNVVITGIYESEDGDINTRMAHDLTKVNKLLDHLDVDLKDSDVLKVLRVGRIKQNNNRMLKVAFANESIRNSVLRNAKKLSMSENFKRIFINPDRTQFQQNQFKHLREELKMRRSNGKNVIIYQNKNRMYFTRLRPPKSGVPYTYVTPIWVVSDA